MAPPLNVIYLITHFKSETQNIYQNILVIMFVCEHHTLGKKHGNRANPIDPACHTALCQPYGNTTTTIMPTKLQHMSTRLLVLFLWSTHARMLQNFTCHKVKNDNCPCDMACFSEFVIDRVLAWC